jgi:hypothetical protein
MDTWKALGPKQFQLVDDDGKSLVYMIEYFGEFVITINAPDGVTRMTLHDRPTRLDEAKQLAERVLTSLASWK